MLSIIVCRDVIIPFCFPLLDVLSVIFVPFRKTVNLKMFFVLAMTLIRR